MPENMRYFEAGELFLLLDCPAFEVYHIMTLQGQCSDFIMIYNPALLDDLRFLNVEATPLLWRGLYDARDYALKGINMRLDPKKFFSENPGEIFMAGNVVLCTISEYRTNDKRKNLLNTYH